MKQPKSENITDIFKPEAIPKLKKGMLLRFNYEGSINELKITYLNKKTPLVRAIKVRTYTPEEVEVVDAKS